MSDIQQSIREAQEALRAAQREEAERIARETEPQRKIAEQREAIETLQKMQTAQQWESRLAQHKELLDQANAAAASLLSEADNALSHLRAVDLQALTAVFKVYEQKSADADNYAASAVREMTGAKLHDPRFRTLPAAKQVFAEWFDRSPDGSAEALLRAVLLSLLWKNTEWLDQWDTPLLERRRIRTSPAWLKRMMGKVLK